MVCNANASPVLLDEASRNRKAQSCPFRLRRKKGLKDFVDHTLVDSAARVPNRCVQKERRFIVRRLNRERTSVRHGVGRVQKKIHEDLLQLDRIGHGFREAGIEVFHDRHAH